MYCGREIERPDGPATSVRVNFQEPELWENGFLVIVNDSEKEADIIRAAAMLPLSADEIALACNSGSTIPLARLRTAVEATAVAERLNTAGIDCVVVEESALLPRKPPVRLRSIAFNQDSAEFIEFADGSRSSFNWDEIRCIVLGRLFTSRIDSLEKRGRGGKRKTLEGSALSEDMEVIDVYPSGHQYGFRILPAGTDFSFLGSLMTLIAAENMKKTAELLSLKAKQARTIKNYVEFRELLGRIWPVSSQTHSKANSAGLIPGRRYERSVSTNNSEQFMRFSRLQSLFQ
jgi:hypothetical protein